MKRWLLWLPFLGFVLLFGIVTFGLKAPTDRTVKSAMVGKPLPDFTLPAIVPGKPGLSSADFAPGKPRLLNVFASWCLPCIAEAPQLMALKQAGVEIDAVAVRDTPWALRDFLARNGDPYERIGSDDRSRVQIALGSSGVPETFIVDGKGIIRYQHIGPIAETDMPMILGRLEQAK